MRFPSDSRPRTPNGGKLPKPSWKDTPDPLPEQRPRSLTPPLPRDVTSSSRPDNNNGLFRLFTKQLQRPTPLIQRTFDQRQSPLLRLPFEIRLMIWDHYLGGDQLHIVRVNRFGSKTQRGRLVGIRCGGGPGDFCVHDCWGKIVIRMRGGCVVNAVVPVEPRYYLGQFNDSSAEEVNYVALLRTCRMIYAETVNPIYERNTFTFDHIDSIVNFSTTVLPQRLDRIRSVRLTYHFPELNDSSEGNHSVFASACTAIARMPNLEDLDIHCHPGRYLEVDSPLVQHEILDPLRRMRQPRIMAVHLFICDYKKAMGIKAEYVPFQLVVHNDQDCFWRGCGNRRLRG